MLNGAAFRMLTLVKLILTCAVKTVDLIPFRQKSIQKLCHPHSPYSSLTNAYYPSLPFNATDTG